MLELEVVPERSLGCEHWEFILGRLFLYNLKQWKNSPSKEWEWNNLQLIMIVTGMQFSQAVCIMQNQVAVMKRVQVIYNENVSNFFTPPFFMEIINIFFIMSVGPSCFRFGVISYNGWYSPPVWLSYSTFKSYWNIQNEFDKIEILVNIYFHSNIQYIHKDIYDLSIF